MDDFKLCSSCRRRVLKETRWRPVEDPCSSCKGALRGMYNGWNFANQQRVAMYLWKKGICLYDCDPAKSTLEDCPRVEPGLYDVIFGRFETTSRWSWGIYFQKLGKRTLQNSTCEIFALEAGNSESETIRGMLQMETPFPCAGPTETGPGQAEIFFTENASLEYASVLKWQRVQQHTELDWIPNDVEASDNAFAQEKRKEVGGPLLWLCRHVNLPEDVSVAIRSFVSSRPSTIFTLEEGDLWLSLQVPNGFPSSEMELVLRQPPRVS